MTILFIMILGLIAGAITSLGFSIHARRKMLVIDGHRVELSRVAQQVKREFEQLPVENRPVEDIVPLLVALDKRTGENPQDRYVHFDNNWIPRDNRRLIYSNFEFKWKPQFGRCSHHNCDYKDYYDLHNEIKSVQKMLKKQRRAELMASTEHAVEELAQIKESMRQEASLVKHTTEKFRELA